MGTNMTQRLAGALLGLALTTATAHAADLTGKWASGPDSKYVFTFDRQGDQFTGKITGSDGHAFKIVDGTIDGDAISFYVLHDADWDDEVKANDGQPFRNTAKGTVSGDEMTFSGSRENKPDVRPY